MESKIKADLERRLAERIQFYRGCIGLKLKKRRTELKMTQEALAKGIISNTFVSKLENNAIHASRDCLLLLMERLNLPTQTIDLPELQMNYLQRALDCYFWNDQESFQALYNEVEGMNFGVLTQIVKLGYHVTWNHPAQGLKVQNELYRYLTSMDDCAFSVFLLFGAGNLISNFDFEEAANYLSSLAKLNSSDYRIEGLAKYLESLLFGRMNLLVQSAVSAEKAKQVFVSTGNFRRLMIQFVDQYEFSIGEKTGWHFDYRQDHIALLDEDNLDRYHLYRALSGETPHFYFDKIGKESRFYFVSLFFQCRLFLEEGDLTSYEKSKAILQGNHYANPNLTDWHRMLILHEKPDLWEYKDYLVNHVLPMACDQKNIHFMQMLTSEIVEILTAKKRYKDACSYEQKLKKEIEKIQNLNKTTEN